MIKKKFLLFGLCILILSSFGFSITPPSGGVSYWNFSSVTDLWGSNDATNNGATSVLLFPTYNLSGDSSPNSFSFTTNDYLTANNVYEDGSDFSVSVWIKPDSVIGNYDIISDYQSTEQPWTAIIRLADDDIRVIVKNGLSDNGANNVLSTTTSITTGSWHNVVVTYDSGNIAIWIDGINQSLTTTGTIPTTPFSSSSTTYIGQIGGGLDINFFEGDIDELKIYNKSLNDTEVGNIYNFGNITGEQISNVSDSVESTAVVKQVGSVTLLGIAFQTIFDSDFNVSVNNTDLYGAYSFNVLSNNNNEIVCELVIDGGVVGNVTRSNVNGVLGSVYLQSGFFSLENGTHNQLLRCRKIGAGQALISNAVGIGHFMIDEDENLVPHDEINFTSSTSSSSFVLMDSINFTISNRSIGGVDNIQPMLVLEWAGSYTNNGGVSELLNTQIRINNTNCSFYPRTVSSGGTGSVSGDCLIKNATQNATYNIGVYGSGTNADFFIDVKIKEFLLSPEEIEGGTGFPVNTTFNGNVDTKLFNFSGGNLNHGLTNVFEKVAFSVVANETTTAVFFVRLTNGTNFTTINFTREITSDVGVLIGHDVLQDVTQDNYQVELWANCGSPTASCTIVGGDGIGYITDVTTTVTNSFNVSVFDNFDNSSVLNFTVSDGATFSSSVGWVEYFTSITSFINLTVSSEFNGGYFNTTIINHNVSNDLNVSLNQTLISWDCKEKISESDINCTSPNESEVFNYNVVGNPHSQSINVTDYFENLEVFNVSALQNSALNSSFGYINLTINSTSSIGSVSNCSYNISSLNYFWSEVVSGSPSSSVILINGSYNILADCDGFAFSSKNVSLSSAGVSQQTFNFSLVTTNSVNFVFRDADSLVLLNNTNISIVFIGVVSFNDSTSNGTLYVDLITPSTYTITADATGYRQTQYLVSVTDRSTQNVTILLQNENNSELVLISVKDKFSGAPIKLSKVTIQKFVDNSWITDQILETDFQGRTEGHFVLSDVFYNFLVEFNNVTFFGVINSNDEKKKIFAEDVNNGILVEIDLDPNNLIGIFQETYSVTPDLSFTNLSNTTGRFRFGFVNNDGFDTIGNLVVYKDEVLVCNKSVTSSTGTLFCDVSISNGTSSFFSAGGFINGELVRTDFRWLDDEAKFILWGVLGYFFSFVITFFIIFVMAKVPSVSVLAGYGGVAAMIFLSVIFRNINLSMWIILIVIAFVIIKIPKKGAV